MRLHLMSLTFLNPIEKKQEVDLDEEIKKHTDLFQADIEYPLNILLGA